MGSKNTNSTTENIYLEYKLSNIDTRPDLINIENSGTPEGSLSAGDHINEEYSELNDNYDNLQVALPIYKKAR